MTNCSFLRVFSMNIFLMSHSEALNEFTVLLAHKRGHRAVENIKWSVYDNFAELLQSLHLPEKTEPDIAAEVFSELREKG
jgi:hypothetical protein